MLEKLKELIAEDKILHLYSILTESDFKGNATDTYIVVLLYTIMIVDLVNGTQEVIDTDGKNLIKYAKEVIRLFERDDRTASYMSVRNWTEALFEYMRTNNLTYKDIFKKNTYDLRKEVSKYLKTSDE